MPPGADPDQMCSAVSHQVYRVYSGMSDQIFIIWLSQVL